MTRSALFLLASVFASAASLATAADKPTLETYFPAPGPGIQTAGVRRIPIKTPRGEFSVWTKRFGNNPRIKVLILHGGPGGNHEFYESFESFLPREGVEFIYYDQLGSAFSDQPDDDSLWQIDRFVDEVEQVRQALGLGPDNFYLLGHSWGGMLAVEYALKHQQHLKGLVISNMMMSSADYNAYAANVLAKQMDPAVVKEVKALEAKGDFESPRYMELLIPHFYEKHFLRRPAAEWPDAATRGFARLNKKIYVLMQGPSEFGMSGRLETWDRKADLPKITVPTLVIGSTHDTMDPQHMEWVSKQVKSGRFLLTGGGHMSMWDDQATFFPGLISFLRDVDEGRKP
jgi:proline iminopeptidase